VIGMHPLVKRDLGRGIFRLRLHLILPPGQSIGLGVSMPT
jgi:hypothetical protein